MKVTHVPADRNYPGMTKAVVNGKHIVALGIWSKAEMASAIERMVRPA
ncbi:hypothetical protein [Companilactobacillus sp.]|nr:hypothetical protein [Companilactobacillus sp.]